VYTRFVGKYVTGRGSVSDPIKYIYTSRVNLAMSVCPASRVDLAMSVCPSDRLSVCPPVRMNAEISETMMLGY